MIDVRFNVRYHIYDIDALFENEAENISIITDETIIKNTNLNNTKPKHTKPHTTKEIYYVNH